MSDHDGSEPIELPISPAQHSLLQLWAARGDAVADQLTRELWELRGPLDLVAMCAAWRALVARHDALRLSFDLSAPHHPRQWIHTTSEPSIEIVGGAGSAGDARTADDQPVRLDLARPPAIRIALIRSSADRHHLLWAAHPLILDRASRARALDEIAASYAALVRGQLPAVVPDESCRRMFERPRPGSDVARIWVDYLGSLTTPPPPGVTPRQLKVARRTARADRAITTELAPATAHRLRAALDAIRTPIDVAILCAWGAVLARYAGEHRVRIGLATNARDVDVATFADTLGPHADLVPVVIDVDPSRTVRAWLGDTRDDRLRRMAWDTTPLRSIHEVTGTDHRSPLFHTTVEVVRGCDRDDARRAIPGIDWSLLRRSAPVHHPLALTVSDGAAITLELRWAAELIPELRARRILDHVSAVLGAFGDGFDRPIGELPAMGDEERRALAAWNRTAAVVPADAWVHEAVVRRARAAPEAIAVVDGELHVGYGELDAWSDRIARRLVDQGTTAGAMVGLALGCSAGAVAAMLGISKAGAAFVLLDRQLPITRLTVALADAGARLCLIDDDDLRALDGGCARIVRLADFVDGAGPAALPPLPAGDGSTLCYVIYTSGTSGEPRGVAVEHRSLINYVAGACRAYRLGASDRVLQLASPSSDWCLCEIFPALAAGATLVIRDDRALESTHELAASLARLRITALQIPAALWHAWVAALRDGHAPVSPTLRVVTIGGERALPEMVRTWRSIVGPAIELRNGYGPTEATIECITCVLSGPGEAALEPWSEVPIGIPMDNVRIHLLRDDRVPVPIGAVGEIYIAGAGVARGYLGRPAGPPFSLEAGWPGERSGPGRMYRTGDLGRLREDGLLEFVGRTDRQVKIQGYRVELAAIETLLTSIAEVREAAVIAERDGSAVKSVIGYVVGAAGIDEAVVRERLRALARDQLPAYMRPRELVFLAALPRTAAGKLDYAALPARPRPNPGAASASDFGSPLEARVAQVWSAILQTPIVSSDDDFFERGGSSVHAAQLARRMKEVIGAPVPLALVFKQSTVRAYAGSIAAHRDHDRAGSPRAAADRPQVDREIDRERAQLREHQHALLARIAAGTIAPIEAEATLRRRAEERVAAFARDRSIQRADELHRVLSCELAALAVVRAPPRTRPTGPESSAFGFRAWTPADVACYQRLLGDPLLWTHLAERYPEPFTDDSARALLETAMFGDHHEVVAVERDGTPVGQCRLRFDRPIAELRGAELAYWLGRDYWGRGWMSAILPRYLERAFTRLALDHVYAWIRADHAASIRVAERAGLRRDRFAFEDQLGAELGFPGFLRFVADRPDFVVSAAG